MRSLFYYSSIIGLVLCTQQVQGQSNYKESGNHFARYTQTGEIKHLQEAKKFIDATYKTRRDSADTRVNILRSMIYSSMAYADSTRSIKNDQDPIDIANNALARLRPRDMETHEGEVSYVKQNIAAAYIFKANKALDEKKFEEAYDLFLKVKELQPQNEDIIYNLGLLANHTDRQDEAIGYYQQALKQPSTQPIQHLELATIYEGQGQLNDAVRTLEQSRLIFPEDKDILFKLIKMYAQAERFEAIVPIIDEAIKHEPENVELNYLAGFSYENEGNKSLAKQFYEKTVALDNNNYEANLALGLLYLEDYLKNGDNQEAQYNAQNYLLKANEIKPHEVNALKSLALYYETSDNELQLDRVNMLLNRLVN